MRVPRILTIGLLVLTSPARAQDLVLTHANVIDGVAAQPQRDVTIIVRSGKIESIGRGSAAPNATVIDLAGRWVLPGFVDAHAHVSDLPSARTALASGATTLRSLGVDHFTDIGVRELHKAGAADLPDVVAAGYHVRPRPSEAFFLDIPRMADMMPRGVSGAESVRRMVRTQIERGVNVIKIMATERAGLPETDPRKRVFTDEELAAAVDEARKGGISVAAHAHGDEGAMAAVRAGVRTIEHGTWLSDATLAAMKERSTCFVPTVATVVDLTDAGGDYDNAALAARGRAMLPRVREAVGKASKLGVRIAAGTDTRYGPQSNRRIPDEIVELQASGMSPMDALKAATSAAAECLGIGQRTGSLRSGLEADLIVVDRDPLMDLSVLRDVVLIVNDGVVAINRLTLR